jgi:hypothetical protein
MKGTSPDISSRWKIELDWGGQLFCSDFSSLMTNTEADSYPIDWTHFSNFISTCFIITAEFLRVVQEFVAVAMHRLTFRQTKMLADAIEVAHWHAVVFNEKLSLRLQLHAIGVNHGGHRAAVPQLVEQEVVSIALILKLLFFQYDRSDGGTFGWFVRDSLER